MYVTCAAVILALGARMPVQARWQGDWNQRAPQAWTAFDTYQASMGHNQDFLVSGAAGGSIFANKRGGKTFCKHCWWEEAEEIELAEDAYDWAKVQNIPDLRKYAEEVDDRCLGFIDNMYAVNKGPNGPYDWSGDDFNDDLDWAIMAFARAYQITGDKNWLTAAEFNFNTVWTRAQAPGGLGNVLSGLIQSQPHGTNWTPNLNSAVNFTFVIGGYMLYDITHDPDYREKSDNVYQWAIADLYTTSVGAGVCNGEPGLTCAKIYDSTASHSDFTYNYGIAIEATVRKHDREKTQYIANWIMHNSNNPNYPYAGTYKGYNILPNYHQGGDNDDGYNGVALRGVGYALTRGYLGPPQLAWAEANVAAAWNIRNSQGAMWNDWTPNDSEANTPATWLYSWDCTPGLVGMFDIPASWKFGGGERGPR